MNLGAATFSPAKVANLKAQLYLRLLDSLPISKNGATGPMVAHLDLWYYR